MAVSSLEHLQNGIHHPPLGNLLLLYLTTIMVIPHTTPLPKHLTEISYVSFLCLLPLVLSLCASDRSLESSLSFPMKHLYITTRSLLSFLFSRLTRPSFLSLSLYTMVSSPLTILLAFCWSHSVC